MEKSVKQNEFLRVQDLDYFEVNQNSQKNQFGKLYQHWKNYCNYCQAELLLVYSQLSVYYNYWSELFDNQANVEYLMVHLSLNFQQSFQVNTQVIVEVVYEFHIVIEVETHALVAVEVETHNSIFFEIEIKIQTHILVLVEIEVVEIEVVEIEVVEIEVVETNTLMVVEVDVLNNLGNYVFDHMIGVPMMNESAHYLNVVDYKINQKE